MEEQKKVTMEWLWSFAQPHKAGYITSVICATIGVAFGMVPYFCVARIVVALIGGSRDMAYFGLWCLTAAGCWLLRYLFHGISTMCSHKATFQVIGEVRTQVANKLTRLPMGYVLETPSGKLKNVLVERIDSIKTTLAHVVPEMTGNVLVSLATIVYLFVLDWRMGLATLITLPIGLLSYSRMMVGYEARFSNYVQRNKHLNQTAVEYIGGIEVIKAFNQSASSYEKFTTAAREAAASAIDWMRSTQTYFALALSVFPAVLVSVLPIGTILYMGGSLPLETFVVAIILSLGIIGPLITIMTYSDDIGKVRTIVGEIAEILDEPDMERPTQPVSLPGYDIRLNNVKFAYRQDEVLHGVNLAIDAGSVTALVGPSGGGKSTIAKLIASEPFSKKWTE